MSTRVSDGASAAGRARAAAMCLLLIGESRGSEVPADVLGWLANAILSELDDIEAALSYARSLNVTKNLEAAPVS